MAAGDVDPVEHPLIEDGALEDRPYQRDLVETARSAHTLVSLPTGLGKTAVSLRVTAHRLHEHPEGKAMFLAPTKPLVEQHAATYRNGLAISDEEIIVFTGETKPADRAALFEDGRVIIATPQVVENDLIGSRIDLAEVVHLTVDECHRATGDYPYPYIADRYHEVARDPLVTGMSASPGDDEEAIGTVIENLGLEEIAVKTESDPDVAAYTKHTEVDWIRIPLPEEVIEMRDRLQDVLSDRLEQLVELGVWGSTDPTISQGDLHEIRSKLQRLIDRDDPAGYEGMSVHAEIMKIKRAIELVETQSVEALERYFDRQRNAARSSGASKATQHFVSDPEVRRAMERARSYDALHPKYRELRILLAETLGVGGGERVIVFTESRDTAESLTDFLGEHFDTRRFVGQTKKEDSAGMTQAEQTATLEAFRDGEFEVLVSTSVGEEGLDVPEVDLVCFFEPVPNAIRSIQRRGRTGRQERGRVVVLMAEDTRDETFFWISRRREQQMADDLETLEENAELLERKYGQATLEGYDDGETADPKSRSFVSEDTETTGTGNATGSRGTAKKGTRTKIANGHSDADENQSDIADFGGGGAEDQSAGADGGGEQPPSEEPAETEPESSGNTDTQPDDSDRETTGEPASEDSEDAVVPEPEAAEGVEIIIDQREQKSTIGRTLNATEGIETRLETLEVGDYVLSDRVAVERKTNADFLDTLLEGDRDLFDQVGDLTRHYGRSVLIVEGEGDIYAERNVHPNAIRGALASLIVDFGISVLFTADEGETAGLLETIARREQEDQNREVSVHGESAAKTLAEQQEYVVSAITDIGPVTARSLLDGLGSVEAVLTADREELQAVDGVGEVTADRIREVVGSDYEPDR